MATNWRKKERGPMTDKPTTPPPPHANIILTTCHSVASRNIERQLGIVHSSGNIGDVETPSKDTEKVLLELQKQAYDAGADAVIGVVMDFQDTVADIIGRVTWLYAYGTAVKLQAE